MFRTPALVAAFLAALVGLLVAAGRETKRGHERGTGADLAGGRVERCVTCHSAPGEDPGGAHARDALGCAACHLGNPRAFGKERAHAGLEREPGALSTVAATCGREGCHAREAARLPSSPMVRLAGIVSVDRFVFGETATPDGTETIDHVLRAPHPTPADSHLRKLCAGCHLGTRRANRDDAILGAGSGCAACHVAPRDPLAARRHPPVDARVPDDRCLGCHSRSGRIALSYAGLAERERGTDGEPSGPCAAPAALHDGRPACRVEPDVHSTAGLRCVDCHLHTDVMGDGTARPHEEAQVEIACETCHGPAPASAEATWSRVDDPITRDLLRQRGESRPPDEPVRLGARGTPVWNVRPSAGGWALRRKEDGKTLRIVATPRDANHATRGHERLGCSACHAAWAPTCSSCHTRFDPGRRQWDFAAARETPGAWVERSDGFGWGPPALGVRSDGRIVPAVPGMLLELEARPGTIVRHRLFAPLEPHTTGTRARTCESCHLSAGALGLGTGTLDLDGAEPAFRPARAAGPDAAPLAADGWTRLFPPTPGAGTRVGFRSLDAAEQRRVLAVGLCLPCHARAADPVWRDLAASRTRLARPSRCRLARRPAWAVTHAVSGSALR